MRNQHKRRIFTLLVIYRWASLLPAIWLLFHPLPIESRFTPGIVFGIATLGVLLITLFSKSLNRILQTIPWLLGLDLCFSAGLIAVSGMTQSPYYLYALSPVLVGAFFFQVQGGVAAAGGLSGLYILMVSLSPLAQGADLAYNMLITQIAGIWLIAVLFGYTSVLLERLRTSSNTQTALSDSLTRQNNDLAAANHQLKILHDLTVLLQSAPDVCTVQQRVLEAVTGELGFSRAVVGLVDPVTRKIGDWYAHPDRGSPATDIRPLSLEPESGLLAQAILENRQQHHQNGSSLSSLDSLNQLLGDGELLILPFWLREHPVGVLLVTLDENLDSLSDEKITVLKLVASQAAIAVGTTMMCIDRARQLAIEQERNRIARDMHDTIAQSLFGFAFSLDACRDMLPENTEQVKQELGELVQTANRVRTQVRRSIFDLWPSSLTLERFQADLQSHVSQCGQNQQFQLQFSPSGNFEILNSSVRRSLYRVIQEAVTNIIRHAGVDSAQVSLSVQPREVFLRIKDDGVGFDPEKALARSYNREHFGLHGIQERIQAMGGESQINSNPGEGTEILIRIPL